MRAHTAPPPASIKSAVSLLRVLYLCQNNITIRCKRTHGSKLVIINSAYTVYFNHLQSCMKQVVFLQNNWHQGASVSHSTSESMWCDLLSLVISLHAWCVMAVIPNRNFVERKGAWATLWWQRELVRSTCSCGGNSPCIAAIHLLIWLPNTPWNWKKKKKNPDNTERVIEAKAIKELDIFLIRHLPSQENCWEGGRLSERKSTIERLFRLGVFVFILQHFQSLNRTHLTILFVFLSFVSCSFSFIKT